MSLYYESAQVLDRIKKEKASIKSVVFGRKDWKSDPKTLFALATEAAKWSSVLSVVVEKSGLLKIEKQLTPTLALLLTHDLLLSKRGLALSPNHGLHIAISRHKARLAAELTKARLRRGCATLEALREQINSETITSGTETTNTGKPSHVHPRWIRINSLRTSIEEQLTSTFAEYKQTTHLNDVTSKPSPQNLIYIDEHIPDLIAIPSHVNLTTSKAYKEGKLILQDKASCFPAYLLNPSSDEGDIIDACAAPGNKTTHLAALASASVRGSRRRRVFACEKDVSRSETLSKMVKLAGAGDPVRIKAKQDFLKLDPKASEFADVSAVLLDPSCSGSGIVGRDDVGVTLHLPNTGSSEPKGGKGVKRKRDGYKSTTVAIAKVPPDAAGVEEDPPSLGFSDSKLEARLAALSSFQLRLLEHAMAFPAAKRITYSTCSIYPQENEHVVVRGLMSEVARSGGWRVLRREEQVEGLRKWRRRGDGEATKEALKGCGGHGGGVEGKVVAEACIRCDKGDGEGTMGFFVVGFVREVGCTDGVNGNLSMNVTGGDDELSTSEDDQDGDEWNGFSDDDR